MILVLEKLQRNCQRRSVFGERTVAFVFVVVKYILQKEFLMKYQSKTIPENPHNTKLTYKDKIKNVIGESLFCYKCLNFTIIITVCNFSG